MRKYLLFAVVAALLLPVAGAFQEAKADLQLSEKEIEAALEAGCGGDLNLGGAEESAVEPEELDCMLRELEDLFDGDRVSDWDYIMILHHLELQLLTREAYLEGFDLGFEEGYDTAAQDCESQSGRAEKCAAKPPLNEPTTAFRPPARGRRSQRKRRKHRK